MIDQHALAVYLYGAMHSFYSESNHAFYEDKVITETRYHQFAEEVAEVVLDPRVKPLFKGEYGQVETGVLLISLAYFESSYRYDIMTCKKLGDNGQAAGPWQTHRFPDTTCQSTFQAAWIAIEMIHESFDICQRFSSSSYALAEYTDGNNFNTQKAWDRSSYRMDKATNYFHNHPFVPRK